MIRRGPLALSTPEPRGNPDTIHPFAQRPLTGAIGALSRVHDSCDRFGCSLNDSVHSSRIRALPLPLAFRNGRSGHRYHPAYIYEPRRRDPPRLYPGGHCGRRAGPAHPGARVPRLRPQHNRRAPPRPHRPGIRLHPFGQRRDARDRDAAQGWLKLPLRSPGFVRFGRRRHPGAGALHVPGYQRAPPHPPGPRRKRGALPRPGGERRRLYVHRGRKRPHHLRERARRTADGLFARRTAGQITA